jgi:hypothetical protein
MAKNRSNLNSELESKGLKLAVKLKIIESPFSSVTMDYTFAKLRFIADRTGTPEKNKGTKTRTTDDRNTVSSHSQPSRMCTS